MRTTPCCRPPVSGIKAALDKLRRLAEENAPYNADLSEEEVDALADEVTRSAIDSLVEKDIIRFQD